MATTKSNYLKAEEAHRNYLLLKNNLPRLKAEAIKSGDVEKQVQLSSLQADPEYWLDLHYLYTSMDVAERARRAINPMKTQGKIANIKEKMQVLEYALRVVEGGSRKHLTRAVEYLGNLQDEVDKYYMESPLEAAA